MCRAGQRVLTITGLGPSFLSYLCGSREVLLAAGIPWRWCRILLKDNVQWHAGGEGGCCTVVCGSMG